MKISKIMLSLFILMTITSIGCTSPSVVTSNTTQTVLSKIKTSSINLQLGGKNSFNLGKNEIKSVVIFLGNNENAYFSYVVTPTQLNKVVDVFYTDPSGRIHSFGAGVGSFTNQKIGDDGKGYYSIDFNYVIPPFAKVPPDEQSLWTNAPDTFVVYVSCEVNNLTQ